jgi:hypothetical protein
MRTIKTILIIPLLVLILISVSLGQETSPNAGTASVLLLRFGPNPRVAGLSEAFTGIADDENALYYNIAGLPHLHSGVVSLNHTEWFEDIRMDNITLGHYLTNNFGVAAGFTHMWMPGIEGRDNQGQEIGSVDVTSSVFNLGFAYKIIPALSLGIGMRYFQDKLASYTTSGFGFDAGLLVNTLVPGLSAGIAVQNFGGKVNYDSEDQNIPLTFRGGLVYKLYMPNIKFALDVVKSVDTEYRLNFGIEYIFRNQFSLRIGNKFTTHETLTPSFSAGFNFNKQYYIDYTFVNYTELGGVHRLGFSFHFSPRTTKTKSYGNYDSSKPVTLLPPANVVAKNSGNELNISWDRVAGVQYNVYARHSSQEKWSKLNKSPLYNNSMKFKSPAASGIFYFRVSSIFGDKEGNYSKEISLNVD